MSTEECTRRRLIEYDRQLQEYCRRQLLLLRLEIDRTARRAAYEEENGIELFIDFDRLELDQQLIEREREEERRKKQEEEKRKQEEQEQHQRAQQQTQSDGKNASHAESESTHDVTEVPKNQVPDVAQNEFQKQNQAYTNSDADAAGPGAE